MRTGSITVITGPMFSGKTEELMRRVRRAKIAKKNVGIFKHSLDNRYADVAECAVISHCKNKIEGVMMVADLPSVDDLIQYDVVAIDEAQFFTKDLVKKAETLANERVQVIIAGIDQDFMGNNMGSMSMLMTAAEKILKLSAVCVSCGNPAYKTYRTDWNKRREQVSVGADEQYLAMCRSCWNQSMFEGYESLQIERQEDQLTLFDRDPQSFSDD